MLLVDIGNSRLKAAFANGTDLHDLPAIASTESGEFSPWCARVSGDLGPQRVLVSNVAGPEVAGAFGQCVFERWHVEAEFVRPQRQCAGMRTQYDDPEQLGVDRWLAALAAFTLSASPVCVVDAGTALTVDIVDEGGVHQGGLIAPGMELMRHSLKHATAQLTSERVDVIDAFAKNTHDAISLGCRDASGGLLTRVHERLSETFPGRAFTWYLTGGAAAALERLMPTAHVLAPDLVLRGLAIVAEVRA